MTTNVIITDPQEKVWEISRQFSALRRRVRFNNLPFGQRAKLIAKWGYPQ